MRSLSNRLHSKRPVLLILCLNGLILLAGLVFQFLLPSLAIVLLPTLLYIFLYLRQNRRLHHIPGGFNIPLLNNHALTNAGTTSNIRIEAGFRINIGNSQCSLPYTTGIFNLLLEDPIMYKNLPSDPSRGNGQQTLFENSMVEYELLNGRSLLQLEPLFLDANFPKKTAFHATEFLTRATKAKVALIGIDLTYLEDNPGFSNEYARYHGYENKSLQAIPSIGFSSFHDADGLVLFLSHLRKLSGGKPVGLRVLISDKNEFSKICFAIRKAEIYPDFIIAEGMDPQKEKNQVNRAYKSCLPVYEALEVITRTLHAYGLEKQIVIISEQQVSSGFGLLKGLAFGARMVHSTISYPTKNGFSNAKPKNSIQQDGLYFQKQVMHDLARMMHAFRFESVTEITWANFMRNLKGLNDYSADFTDGTGLEHEPFHVLQNHQLIKKDLKMNIRNRKN